MKTKELIKKLQEADPSGELEVTVENVDILAITPMPAYWDGYAQILITDKEQEPYYNVIGAKYLGEGTKVVIYTHSIEQAIMEQPALDIDISELSPQAIKYYTQSIERWRKEAVEV